MRRLIARVTRAVNPPPVGPSEWETTLAEHMHIRFDRVDAAQTTLRECQDQAGLSEENTARNVDRAVGIGEEILQNMSGSFAAMGQTLVEQSELINVLHDNSQRLADDVQRLSTRPGFVAEDHLDPASLDADLADIANFAGSHRGWASQAGLWFNPAIQPAHRNGGVEIGVINERIAELPYVLQRLADLPVGSRVLDVGASESTLSISLATLGYVVTAVDPREYPLTHPNLTVVRGLVEDLASTDAQFDAVVSLSTIEHIGVGSYENNAVTAGDVTALDHMRSLTRPGGRLILTAPYGRERSPELQRVYSQSTLGNLVRDWDVVDTGYLIRVDDQKWTRTDKDPGDDAEAVVLLTAINRPDEV